MPHFTKTLTLASLCVALACSSNKSTSPTVTHSGGASSSAGSSGSGVGGSAGSSSAGSNATGAGPNLGDLTGGAAGMLADAGPLSGDMCGTTCPDGVTSCSPETCDGIDNNCDGIRDNVDKNSDGICDCLLIATLGNPGTWGQGDVFSAWLSARSNNGAANLGDQTLTPELLAQYEVIVAQDVDSSPHNGGSGAITPVHQYTPAEVSALQDWVNKGGGFMTLIGFTTSGEEANINSLLAPFSMGYVGSPQILPAVGGSTAPITMWTPNAIDNGVTAMGIDTGLAVMGGTVFATAGGYDVASMQTVGLGHVLVWGDEWITYNSEWTQHTDYQVELFWVNAIKWLTATSTCQVPVPPRLIP